MAKCNASHQYCIYLLLFFLVASVDSKVVQGAVDSDKRWIFLSRFCFLGGVGKLEYEVSYAAVAEGTLGNSSDQSSSLKLLIYSDDEWDSIYTQQEGDVDCDHKLSLLDGSMIRLLSTQYRYTGCTMQTAKGDNSVICKSALTFGTAKEKWWYIAISRCASDNTSTEQERMRFTYKLTMTNNQDNNKWFEHFSADEFYILQTDIAFLFAYTALSSISVYVAWKLVRLQFYHRTYKLYMASLLLHLLSLALLTAFWADYGIQGKPKIFWKYSGRFAEYLSTVLFVVLLILLAKGYTITRGRIRPMGVVKLLVFSAAYIVTTMAMFIWEATSFDPGRVLYIYDSSPGYCLIATRLIAWLWFLYAAIFTLKKYSEKRLFYLPLLFIYTIWFWATPTMVFVALDVIPKWTREKVVNGINLFIIFLGHMVFLILTWPTKVNKNFPFHVTTTQIESSEHSGRGDNYVSDEVEGITPDILMSHRRSMFTTDTRHLSTVVNPDSFPHETGEYIERRGKAMEYL